MGKLNAPSAWNIFLSNDDGDWDRFSQAENSKWSVSHSGVVNSTINATFDWTFIAHTFDGLTQKLYVDDIPILSVSDTLISSQPFIDIGHIANSAYPLNGLMKGVFFFDQTLLAMEVETIRAGGAGANGVPETAGISISVTASLTIFLFGMIGALTRKFKLPS